jgi:ATP-dependent DNA helicase DinG
MITEDEKALIRECMDALRNGIEGFTSRRPQLQMVAAVANTLGRCRSEDEAAGSGDHIALVEAGTGTGKSFGALVPALVMARGRGKRLVVSSSTVALQHQYAEKDAPTLQALLPFRFRFAVAKGRRRYVCTAKLDAEATDAKQDALALEERREPAPNTSSAMRDRRTVILGLAESFESERWNGDRDSLALPVSDEIWRDLTNDRQGCSGNKCAVFSHCPFYTARRLVREADLVIANHDLVLSALDMEAGSVLPAASETIYVFDEAHNLTAKVVEHFSARHALLGAQEWLRDSTNAVRDAVLAMGLDQSLLRDARATAERLSDTIGALYRQLHANSAFEEKRARRFKDGVLPAWAQIHGHEILNAGLALRKTFVVIREALLEQLACGGGGMVTRLLSALGFYAGKLDNVNETWELLLADDGDLEAPVARWVECHNEGSAGSDYLVCAAPISGSDKLRKLLWNRASAAVLMSAALTSCGTFNLFLRQSGLGVYTSLEKLQVDSPFDYRANAQLVIPAMRADPGDAVAHTQEIVARLPALLRTRGTLALFASARQMRSVYAQIPEALRRITLVQGTMPKMELLARHRAAIDRGESSVLFGLHSMAEGVDLPGEYCTHVVIAKLPFSVPDSPLEEARREWVQAQGRSPFIELSVPEAAVRLKQQLGRLLRTTQDRGTVTILDGRLVTKRWGRLLMRGLPDFEIVVEALKS